MKKFKKLIFTFMFAVLLMPVLNAASVNVNTEEELLNAVKSDGTIVLNDNITLTKPIIVNGNNVIVDFNGKTITIQDTSIKLYKGKLELTGKGTIKDVTKKNGCTIWAYGSNDAKDTDYTTLNVGKDITIDTTEWGVCLANVDKSNKSAYGLTLNLDGKILSSGKESGGMTIFGNIKNGCSYDKKCDLTNAPVVNIGKTAYIKADGDVALYGAGLGTWNINGGTYESKSAIGIKSGKLVINDGTFIATGDPKTG